VRQRIVQDLVRRHNYPHAVEDLGPDADIAPAVDVVGPEEQPRAHAAAEVSAKHLMLLGAKRHRGGQKPDEL